MSPRQNVHPPAYVVWEITLRCNLSCSHCGSRAGSPRSDELSTEEALDLIDQMAELGVQEVTLIGGEAFLRPDWLTLAAAITAHGITCTMTTGGYGISDRIAAKMAAAGIKTVSVSVDGLEETHDRLRGRPGSWKQCLKTIARLKRAGIRAGVNTQFNRLTAPEIPMLYERLREAGIGGWQIQLTVPMGNAADNTEILFQPDELLDLYPMLGELAQWAEEDGISLQAGNNVGYYGPYARLLRGQHGLMWGGCTAGVNTLGLEANGAIKGCPSLPTRAYTGGNIRDHRLADVVFNAPELTFNDQQGTDHLWGFCGGCEFASLCRGGCSWTSHVFFDRRGNNPYCHHRALTQAARGVRERLHPAHPAPGVPFDNGSFELRTIPYQGNAPEGFSLRQVRWPARWLEVEPDLTAALEAERDRSVVAYRETALNETRKAFARAKRLHHSGELAAAEAAYREVLPALEAALGEHPEVAEAQYQLAALLLSSYQPDKAEPLIERSIALSRTLYGEHHLLTIRSLNNAAVLKRTRGDHDAAADQYRYLVRLLEEMEGPGSDLLPTMLGRMMVMLFHTDRHQEGYAAATRGLQLTRAVTPDDTELADKFQSFQQDFARKVQAERSAP